MKAIINGKEYELSSFTVVVPHKPEDNGYSDLMKRCEAVRDELSVFAGDTGTKCTGVCPSRFDLLRSCGSRKYLVSFEDWTVL